LIDLQIHMRDITDDNRKQIFQSYMKSWSKKVDRDMPWQGIKDPYKVWLSEIILQQTRVEQGRAYYLKFINAFPTVIDLANANEDRILGLWSGLGYYSRARNLHHSAQMIRDDFGGKFPDNYKDLLLLKGVGDYTASAIASFVYDLPCAVLDGNVFRVLSRFDNINTPIDSSLGKKQFKKLADSYLLKTEPGVYNQGIMNFGAVLCKPKPDCEGCSLNKDCISYNEGTHLDLPVKSKKLVKKNRFFNYLVSENSEEVFLQKRLKKDIWQGLYEPFLLETASVIDQEKLYKLLHDQKLDLKLVSDTPITTKQTLSHQHIHAFFWKIKSEDFKQLDLQSFTNKKIKEIGLPKVVDWYLNK